MREFSMHPMEITTLWHVCPCLHMYALRNPCVTIHVSHALQVDEPALREGLPLKDERWASYLEWGVDAFRLATAVAAPSTQVGSGVPLLNDCSR